ncbi:hypothetical protein SNEBB_005893 [Seison nebaliae]|nr:hypothetical protein SNEBB_005893 [Seison nebaliae]
MPSHSQTNTQNSVDSSDKLLSQQILPKSNGPSSNKTQTNMFSNNMLRRRRVHHSAETPNISNRLTTEKGGRERLLFPKNGMQNRRLDTSLKSHDQHTTEDEEAPRFVRKQNQNQFFYDNNNFVKEKVKNCVENNELSQKNVATQTQKHPFLLFVATSKTSTQSKQTNKVMETTKTENYVIGVPIEMEQLNEMKYNMNAKTEHCTSTSNKEKNNFSNHIYQTTKKNSKNGKNDRIKSTLSTQSPVTTSKVKSTSTSTPFIFISSTSTISTTTSIITTSPPSLAVAADISPSTNSTSIVNNHCNNTSVKIDAFIPLEGKNPIMQLVSTPTVNTKDVDNKVILNVGGTRYETYRTTLKKIPATRLSKLTDALVNYDDVLNEYFFDRHPGVFNQILNYYRTGKLHYPTNVCGPLFESELEFWGLDVNQVEPCCWQTFNKHRETQDTLQILESLDICVDKTPYDQLVEKFHYSEPLTGWQQFRMDLWQVMNEPKSSLLAKVVSIINIFFIIVSICVFCFKTFPGCKVAILSDSFMERLGVYDENNPPFEQNITTFHTNNEEIVRVPHPAFAYIDYISNTWFTCEYLIRLIISPHRMVFVKTIFNIIDAFALLYFYIDVGLIKMFLKNSSVREMFDFLGIIRICRLFRIIRYHPGLSVMAHSLRASSHVLVLLIFFLLLGIVIFASLVYYTERLTKFKTKRETILSTTSNNQEFRSIPDNLWFGVITMTKCGFGDMVPESVPGMVVGGFCALTGVLIADLLMPIIVNNFTNYYKHSQARAKLPKERRRVLPVEAPRVRNKNRNQYSNHNNSNSAILSNSSLQMGKHRMNESKKFSNQFSADTLEMIDQKAMITTKNDSKSDALNVAIDTKQLTLRNSKNSKSSYHKKS